MRRQFGTTALIYAANHDSHTIVQMLLGARADVNTKDGHGCALPLGRPAAVSAAADGAPTAPAPAPSGRYTALHHAAMNGCTKSAVALLVGGADQTITAING
jgi:ankyrin repeat protein